MRQVCAFVRKCLFFLWRGGGEEKTRVRHACDTFNYAVCVWVCVWESESERERERGGGGGGWRRCDRILSFLTMLSSIEFISAWNAETNHGKLYIIHNFIFREVRVAFRLKVFNSEAGACHNSKKGHSVCSSDDCILHESWSYEHLTVCPFCYCNFIFKNIQLT